MESPKVGERVSLGEPADSLNIDPVLPRCSARCAARYAPSPVAVRSARSIIELEGSTSIEFALSVVRRSRCTSSEAFLLPPTPLGDAGPALVVAAAPPDPQASTTRDPCDPHSSGSSGFPFGDGELHLSLGPLSSDSVSAVSARSSSADGPCMDREILQVGFAACPASAIVAPLAPFSGQRLPIQEPDARWEVPAGGPSLQQRRGAHRLQGGAPLPGLARAGRQVDVRTCPPSTDEVLKVRVRDAKRLVVAVGVEINAAGVPGQVDERVQAHLLLIPGLLGVGRAPAEEADARPEYPHRLGTLVLRPLRRTERERKAQSGGEALRAPRLLLRLLFSEPAHLGGGQGLALVVRVRRAGLSGQDAMSDGVRKLVLLQALIGPDHALAGVHGHSPRAVWRGRA
eukprot:scaffold240_cov243-Pinguiococcus_pyrenoidosus.AAC.16